jgi:hypothetical protein
VHGLYQEAWVELAPATELLAQALEGLRLHLVRAAVVEEMVVHLMQEVMVTKELLLFVTLALNEEAVEQSQRLAAIPTMYLQLTEHTQHEDIRSNEWKHCCQH